MPEIAHYRNVEDTLFEALIKFRERIPKMRVETPQYMSESDAVDGSHPTASSCRITVLLPIVRSLLMAINGPIQLIT
jgi:hypothetical protein